MINLDSVLKSRDIILPTKLCLVKDMVFPGVTYGCESDPIKKAEHQSSALSFFHSPTVTSMLDYWKNHSFD